MKPWDSLRNYFYQKNLRRELARLQVKRSIINLHDAKYIGILFDYLLPSNESAVLQLAAELRGAGKEVEIIGFNKKKETVAREGIRLLNTSEVNWLNVPQGEAVTAFVNKKFDLLLCCFLSGHPALEYMACISQAQWRVGAYATDKTDCYDLMVQVEAGKDVAYMIEQIKHFLNQIHYDSKKA